MRPVPASPPSPKTLNAWQILILLWGTGGVLALLVRAIWRLYPYAMEPLTQGKLTLLQAVLYVAWVAFSAYAEGYRGFQLRFSPRVVSRAYHLGHHPTVLHVLLAPLFCMGLVHATRRRLIGSWFMVLLIVGFIVLLRMTPQPWRGLVDGGVVVGLVWGILSILIHLLRAFGGVLPDVDAELPSPAPGQ